MAFSKEPSKRKSISCRPPHGTARNTSTSIIGSRARCRLPTSLRLITILKKHRTTCSTSSIALCGNAAIAKVATQVNPGQITGDCWICSPDQIRPLIVAGMGDIGQITRIVGPSRGSFLSYAASTRQAAPGQLTVTEMLDTYKFRRIRRSTQLLGILGMPVGHSLSPLLHNRAFEFANLDFAYVKLPAPDVNDFMENARAVGFSGFSVTIPHKIAMVPFMSRLTPAAGSGRGEYRVRRRREWVGDNTDVHGVEAALQSVGFNARGKKVVIMGKGGGAKAAVAAVKDAVEVRVLPRAEVSAAGSTACDLLINATPVGMFPKVDESPVSGSIAADVVFDMVYNPATTTLLRSRQPRGKRQFRELECFLHRPPDSLKSGRSSPRHERFMLQSKKRFRIPASTANLGSGFDALGLGLARYLRIALEPADQLEIQVIGRNVDRIPTNEDNLIYKVAENTARRRGRPLPMFHLWIDNEIPLARGMGSSAAAIIAGITCYEFLTGDHMDEQEFFRCAFDFEDHPDNLGACLYGGLIAGSPSRRRNGSGGAPADPLPAFDGRRHPVLRAFDRSRARGSTEDVFVPRHHLQHATISAYNCSAHDMQQEVASRSDARPYPSALSRKTDSRASKKSSNIQVEGLLGVSLSGAGPTVFAFVEPEFAKRSVKRLRDVQESRCGGSSAAHRN